MEFLFFFNSDNFLVIALCFFKLSMFSWNICLTLFSSVYSTSCNMSFIFVMFISLFFFHCPKCYHLTFQWILLSYQILFDLSNFFFEFYIYQVYIFSSLFENLGEYLSDIFLFVSEVILLLWILNVYFVIIFLPSTPTRPKSYLFVWHQMPSYTEAGLNRVGKSADWSHKDWDEIPTSPGISSVTLDN